MTTLELSQTTVARIRARDVDPQSILDLWTTGYLQAPQKDQVSWLRLCWENMSVQHKTQLNYSVTALETALAGWERETKHPTSRMVAESWKTLAKTRLQAVQWPQEWTMQQRQAVIWSIAHRIGNDFDQSWLEQHFPQACTQQKVLGGTIVQMLVYDLQQQMLSKAPEPAMSSANAQMQVQI